MTMRKIRQILLTVTAVLAGFHVNPATAEQISDFGLLDQHGVFHQLSRYSLAPAVALYVHSVGDEASAAALPALNEMASRYREEGIVFMVLDPAAGRTRAEVLAAADGLSADIPVLIDSSQVVSLDLGVTSTGEAYLLDPAGWQIIFRGALVTGDEKRGLEATLKAILAGRTLAPEETRTDGVEIAGTAVDYVFEREFSQRQISYLDEIAPLLQRRCASCHVSDSLAPWSMSSHRMIQGWSPMIKEVLLTRRMPPGQIDTQVGSWQEIHHLTDDELALLVHWIDAGARRAADEGDEDPLTLPVEAPPEWALGEPDMIIDIPAENVPASGVVDFRIKHADLDLTQDRWVTAVAYDVGATWVLHSVLVYAVDPGVSLEDPVEMMKPENAEFISLFVPGRLQEEFSADSAFLLRADRDLAFKLRYITTGREAVDNTRVGLYFTDRPPRYRVRHVTVGKQAFSMKAGEAQHREHAESEVFDKDVLLEAVAPQMHGRGSSTALAIQFPDGSRRDLLSVPNYNFNWQLNYELIEPLLLPAGSRLLANALYDNSEGNPYNPDPEVDVRAGVTVQDEVFGHYVRVLEER